MDTIRIDVSYDDDNYDDADLYGEDAYDDDEPRDELYDEDAYDETYDDEDAYDEEEYAEAYEEDEGSWWDEGLIALLLVAGVVLFLFPEPFTSTLGIILLATGVIAWVADALM